MATLIEVSRLLNARGDLWNKFRGGVIKSAASVYAEADTTPNHAARLNWARDILANGNVDARAEEMYRMGMTNPTIASLGDASTDNDVEYVIAVHLDTVAAGV